jgi:hypothetical protein
MQQNSEGSREMHSSEDGVQAAACIKVSRGVGGGWDTICSQVTKGVEVGWEFSVHQCQLKCRSTAVCPLTCAL